MAPKSGHTRPGQGLHASGKSSRRHGGGASDARKGGKTGGGGGSGAIEGGAMATAVMQKKAVGGISPGVEAQVRLLLQELHRQELLHHHHQQQNQHHQQHHQYQRHRLPRDGGGDTDAAGPAAAPLVAAVDNRTLTAFSAVWDQLLAAGFGAEQIKRVVPELPRSPHALLEAAMDWLCLHLPVSELPQKFKSAGSGGAAYGAAPVRILAVAQQQQQQQPSGALAGAPLPGSGGEPGPGVFSSHAEGRSDRLWDDSGPSSGSGSGSSSEGEATEVVAEAEAVEEGAAGKDEGRTATEGGADGGGGRGGGGGGGGGGGMKEWILRYMDEQASSDDEGGGTERPVSSCSSVADFEWEVWGDPREVARRRAERARSRLPMEERRRQLAEEWGQAKEAAARAKATGDKARQKDAGLMIRDLKQEMVTLGVTEQQLDEILGGPSGGTVAAAAGGKAAQQRPGGAAVAVAAAATGGDRNGRRGHGKAQAGVNASKEEKEKGGKGQSKGGKDKDKERERGKGKEKGGKDKDGGQGKEKGKRKGKGRRAASPPPPASSSSEPDSEMKAEIEATAAATASAATGATAAVSQRRDGSEIEDDMVPDSWEERDPGPGMESAAATATGVITAAGDGHTNESWGGGEIRSLAGTLSPGCQEVGSASGEVDVAAVAGATGGGVSVSGCKDATTTAEAAEAAEPVSFDLFVDVGEGLAPLSAHTQDVVAPVEAAAAAAAAEQEEEEENGGKVTTTATMLKAAADGDAGYSLPGLFDDDGTGALESSMPAVTAPPSALLRAAAEAPGPWAEYGSSGAGGKAGGSKAGSKRSAAAGKTSAAPVPVDAPKPPRALLSQLCQKLAWSQPRFERLTAAAAAADGGVGFRYNVVLDLGPARGLAKKRNLYGIRVYGVPPARVQQQPDGGPPILPTWPDPSTAQDAAAARALYEVAPALQLQQSMFQSLAPQWRQQWLEWEAADGSAAAAAAAGAAGAAAEAAGTAAAAAKQAEEEKLEMLRELLSQPPPPPPPPLGLPLARLTNAATAAAVAVAEPPQLPPAATAAAAAPPFAAVQEIDGVEGQELPEEDVEVEGDEEEEGSETHAEPMNHHDGDAVEQEEWEDMMAIGEPVQDQDQDLDLEGVVSEQASGGAAAAVPAAAGDGALTAEVTAEVTAGNSNGDGDSNAEPHSQARRGADAESAASASLRAALERWADSPAGRAMAAARAALPIAAVRGELLEALRQGDVVVVSGDTGCGKTTQVPQYLLEDAIFSGAGGRTHVVVTQPRRIAAISVAERVAEERGEPPPGSPGPSSTTGYHVRLGAAVTRHTRLTFCTTGILLRRLAGDPSLRGVTHVVVDEVHERSLQSDFLIALLRDLLVARRMQRQAAEAQEAAAASAALSGGSDVAAAAAGPPSGQHSSLLKVVLMSATLDAKLFANYFGGCPVLQAAGRTFPVSRLFLEDVYEATGYRLASDAPAALRRHGPGVAHVYAQRLVGGSRGQRDLVAKGFGDDEALAAPLNPEYDPDLYVELPLHVRRNLARLDEHRIDYDLLEALLSYIDATTEPGAVLVFLPGIGEINHLYDRLTAQRAYTGLRGGGPAVSSYSSARCVVLPLHSAVPPAGQRAALRPPAPGLRKVVLATNIAETSLTIEDVVAVVDTGRHKERRFNPARSMSMLVEDWVSAASAQQRAGRAGRVRPGVSYATYTRARFESGLRRYGAPEITRVPLEELVLQILLMGLGPVSDFLSQVLEPPQPRAVTAALEVLRQVGALETAPPAAATATAAAASVVATTGHNSAAVGATGAAGGTPAPFGVPREVLSPLGRQLALLPVAPRLGKLLVVGALLGCLAPAITIAATMSHKSPFLTPTDDRGESERARRALAAPGAEGIAAGQQSDHLLMVAAYELWRIAASPKYGGGTRVAAQVARRHFLHIQTLEQLSEIRCQLAAMLADARLVQPAGERGGYGSGYGDGDGSAYGGGGGKAAMAAAAAWLDDPTAPWNKFARDPLVVKAALCAALSPAVAVMGEDSCPTSPPRWGDAAPGPGAGEEVFVHPSSVVAALNTPQLLHPYLVYLEKVKTARLYLRDVTAISPLSLMLFGGPLTVLHAEGAVLVGSGSGSGSGVAPSMLRIACRAQTAVLVKQLRGALERLLERRFTGSSGSGSGSDGGGLQVAETVVGIVRQMLREEDEQRSMAARLL